MEKSILFWWEVAPEKTASPPYKKIFSDHMSVRAAVRGIIRGKKPLSATTTTPASSGPPRYRYFSCLAVAPTKAIDPITPKV